MITETMYFINKTDYCWLFLGQARLDGPFCDYTESDKMRFLNKLYSMGVRNIEMEATAFAAFTNEAGVRAAIVCVAFLDRLLGDQVSVLARKECNGE